MNEFKEIRENIDSLIVETKSWIAKKSISESMQRLEKARELLFKLKGMAKGEFQEQIVSRRKSDLKLLGENIDEILSKREAGEKRDGNIVFKCNWNDKHYKTPCSLEAYNFNLSKRRAWCSSPLCECRRVTEEISLNHPPCYESIALKEMVFGAGWDHKKENKPRHIKSVRSGRMAILTTRPPGVDEKDRIIIGCLLIERVSNSTREETKIFGDKTKSIEVDYDEIKVNFWDYYKNTRDKNKEDWRQGLYRYFDDEPVLNILKGIREKYKNTQKDVSKIIYLIRYYEEIISKKN